MVNDAEPCGECGRPFTSTTAIRWSGIRKRRRLCNKLPAGVVGWTIPAIRARREKLEMKDLTDAEKAEITLLLQKHRPMQITN